MRKRIAAAVFLLVGSFGVCQAVRAEVAQRVDNRIAAQFNPAEYAWAQGSGPNVVAGQAFLRTVGGEVRTCAGKVVYLVPDGSYSRALMRALFGGVQRGYVDADDVPKLPPTPSAYQATVRGQTCDAQGNFGFEGLPNGAYYLVSEVTWALSTRPFTRTQGGEIMMRVELQGGQFIKVVLTN